MYHIDPCQFMFLILTSLFHKGKMLPLIFTRGELAQWLEQRNHNPLVRGSNP